MERVGHSRSYHWPGRGCMWQGASIGAAWAAVLGASHPALAGAIILVQASSSRGMGALCGSTWLRCWAPALALASSPCCLPQDPELMVSFLVKGWGDGGGGGALLAPATAPPAMLAHLSHTHPALPLHARAPPRRPAADESPNEVSFY